MKIKKGDQVLVIAGKDIGKIGTIEKIINKTNKAKVKGINLYKKHSKASRKSPKGGVISIEAPISLSNLAPICSACGKKTSFSIKIGEKKRVRICRKCKAEI